MLFHRAGTINGVMELFGFSPVDWMEGGQMRWPVIMMFLWKNIGFNMIILLASLNAIPKEVLESSLLDGAGWLRRQVFIIIPHIIPALVFVIIISMINSLKIFKEAYVLAGPYPDDSLYTLQHFIYNQFNQLNYNYVVSAAFLFLVVIFILVGFLFLFEYKIKE
jgi:multiple sugar transport system permease protein